MRRVALAGLFLAWVAAPAGAADIQRVEALGAAPVHAKGKSRNSPRDVALQRALQGAVWRVAIEQLDTAGSAADDSVVAEALGSDPLVYATRFRIVEDRGERPALFSNDPEIETEYVVLAEVHVNIDRVRERLSGAGLMQLPSGDGGSFTTRVTLVDITGWAELQAVRTLLREIGAESTVPVDLVRGRAVLAVRSRYSPTALVRALRAAAPAELSLEALGAGPGGLELRARFLDHAGSSDAARQPPFDTSGPERY